MRTKLFSFAPDESCRDGRTWIFQSPSVKGWAKDNGTSDVRAEWGEFIGELTKRQEKGCFGKGESLSSIRRLLAERMSLPAGEALLFFYGFGDAGFVDLQPGMQVGLERPVEVGAGGQGASASSIEATYEVVATGGSGVALQLERPARRQGSGMDGHALFGGTDRLKGKALLRLFLQSVGSDGVTHDASLLGAMTGREMGDLTRGVEASGRGGCAGVPAGEGTCISFGPGTAVNLLLRISINRRAAYRPIGTPLSWLIGTLPEGEQARAMATVQVQRPMLRGGYASVRFPRTSEGMHDVVLVAGDRVTWSVDVKRR